jgi:hypothetical protein
MILSPFLCWFLFNDVTLNLMGFILNECIANISEDVPATGFPVAHGLEPFKPYKTMMRDREIPLALFKMFHGLSLPYALALMGST